MEISWVVITLILAIHVSMDIVTYGQVTEQQAIDEVHVVFMNHLDVGYNGVHPKTGFINVVLNAYFQEYFPRAVALSRALREGGYQERFIYTTHSWLVHLYLNCPDNLTLTEVKLKCPSQSEREQFIKTVAVGDITWHAGPMNLQPENMDQMLLELSLNISQNLDERFNITRRFTSFSQRDVPGLTQTVIPTLVKKGVASVVEVPNSGSSTPAVPRLAKWTFAGNDVIYMCHPGEYPAYPGPNLSRENCITAPNFSKALCVACRADNLGPPLNIQEILSNYASLKTEFPGAKIIASTFENFTEAVQPIKNQLPVVSKEVGDTWIFGISSDPRKMAEYRAVSRTVMNCVRNGKCDPNDPRIMACVFYLIKLPEHTWGLPGVYDDINWSNKAFSQAKSGVNYTNCEKSWSEQREFVTLAVQALGDHPIVSEVKKSLKDVVPTQQDLSGFSEVGITDKFQYEDGMEMQFAEDGSLNHLYDPINKVIWTTDNGFGRFLYRTFNEEDFRFSSKQYSYDWPFFGKNNMTANVDPESKFWPTKLQKLYKWDGNDFVLVAQISMADQKAHTDYGAPAEIWLMYVYRPGIYDNGFDLTLWWFDKTSTRLPESLMLYFSPVPRPPLSSQGDTVTQYSWRISKLGQMVDPTNVVLNGSQYQHATDKGIYYTDEHGSGLELLTIDVPAFTIGTISRSPSPFPTPMAPLQQGEILSASFNLYNNIWDTNYILWYPFTQQDKDFKARFKINFKGSG